MEQLMDVFILKRRLNGKVVKRAHVIAHNEAEAIRLLQWDRNYVDIEKYSLKEFLKNEKEFQDYED